jgi:hypothetical protein
MGAAADRVWAMVSGLPSGKREHREFMVLQAYIDDSGNEPTSPVFVLAGFVASAGRWATFSNEWQSALDEPPGLAYFKMSEAESLREEFSIRKGWTEQKRDDRLITFARIIAKYAEFRVHASIRHEDFSKHIKSLRTPKRISPSNNPFFILFHVRQVQYCPVAAVVGQSDSRRLLPRFRSEMSFP